MQRLATRLGIGSALAVSLLAAVRASEADEPEVVFAPRRIEIPVEQVAGSVTVIGREEIERKQWRTLAQALEEVPGLNVVQSGGPGKLTSVFTRGTNSGHTLVMMDGIELTDPSLPNPGFDVGHFLTENVERIEVFRGPASPLYGSEAVGGVINIVTRKGTGRPSTSAWGEVGAHNTAQGAVALRGAGRFVDYSLDYTSLHTRGFSVTPSRLGGHERDGYDNRTLSGRIGLHPADGLELDFFGRYIDTETELDVAPDDPDSDEETDQLFLRAEARLERAGGRWSQTLGASLTDHDRDDSNPADPADGDSSKGSSDGTRLAFDWRHDLRLNPNHLLTLGMETERESVDANAEFRSAFGSFESRTHESTRTSAVFAQEQFSFGGRLFGTAAVRLDDHDDFGSHTTYRLAAAYLHRETGTKLRGSVGTGYKAPPLADLYGTARIGNFPVFRGNPDLEPEKSVGWEIGVEQGLLGGHAKLGVTYFQSRIRDLIEFTPAFDSKENRERAEIYGLESFIQAEVAERLSLRLDHTYTMAEDDETGEDLLRRPKHKITGSAELRPLDRILLSATAIYIGRRKDIDAVTLSRKTLGGFTVVNVQATVTLSRGWRLFGRIDNLFDRDFEDPDGFATSGFAGYVGVGAEF
jgi:vitamin B12 transporter